jgi:mono/diheme cytochrome c family protein
MTSLLRVQGEYQSMWILGVDMRKAVVPLLSLLGLAACGFAMLANAARAQASAESQKGLLARGEYLVTVGGCADCHSPKVFSAKGPVPDPARFLAGTPSDAKVPAIPPGLISRDGWGGLTTNDMTVWAGPWGVSFAANLTPDKTTGLGNWTEAAFVNSIRTGKHKGALREILPPMPWQSLAKLSDGDLKAMFAYLKTIKPILNKVPDPIPPKR